MRSYLLLVVGILGNAASLLLYGAPMVTFRRVIRNRSTESFSGFPYAIALLNSLLYSWYGSPLISHGLDNILVLTINGVGIVLEFIFVCIFLKYALPTAKKRMVRTMVGVTLVFACISTVSLVALGAQKDKKKLVGISGMVVTVVMYASPLSDAWSVIETKNVEYMPIHFSVFALINSCLWMIYFLLDNDLILACPNIIGVPLGIGQIVLYCMYRKQASNEEKKVGPFDPEIGLKEKAVAEETDSTDAEETGQQSLEMLQIQKMEHTFDRVGEK